MRALPIFHCDCCRHSVAQYESERWGVRFCHACGTKITMWFQLTGLDLNENPLVTELLDGPCITDDTTHQLVLHTAVGRNLVDKWVDSETNR